MGLEQELKQDNLYKLGLFTNLVGIGLTTLGLFYSKDSVSLYKTQLLFGIAHSVLEFRSIYRAYSLIRNKSIYKRFFLEKFTEISIPYFGLFIGRKTLDRIIRNYSS